VSSLTRVYYIVIKTKEAINHEYGLIEMDAFPAVCVLIFVLRFLEFPKKMI